MYNMIEREISKHLPRLSGQYPVITITGPRQSGKTTLCRMVFPDKEYVSLEDPDARIFARTDPKGFLEKLEDGAIIDEIQRVPDLLSYIQTIVDNKQQEGQFIIIGSQQFSMMENITQSLAGRTALLRLLPFTMKEAYGNKVSKTSLEKVIYTGFYPGIFDKKLNPYEMLSFYVNTYIERDVRSLINIKDLAKFEVFLKLCAGRTGQVLNYSSLGNDCGVNHSTVKSWLSVLEASYIIMLLRPYYKNYNKRLIKSPKLYFLDTGLASYLLGIQDESQISNHPLRGYLFESLVVSELLKIRYNNIKQNNLYYFRDNTGNEVDLIIDNGPTIACAEIKSGKTISTDFFKGLNYFETLSNDCHSLNCIYGGDKSYKQNRINILPWRSLPENL